MVKWRDWPAAAAGMGQQSNRARHASQNFIAGGERRGARKSTGAAAVSEEEPPSRGRALLALLLLVVLVAGGWVLARHLAEVAQTEDCLMAGRRDCAVVRE